MTTELKTVAPSSIHCHSGVAPPSWALSISSSSLSLRALKQIGQTSIRPPASAYCAASADSVGHPSQAMP